MASPGEQNTTYVVPTYEAPEGCCWYHFLHGNVPGHEIDFIYRPDVPQGALTRQHFSHLSRLVRYIEPRSRSACAFAIGNLSRDDTHYEPGHGAVALIFGLRIRGAKDHAGRQDPPFCHAVAAVDRHLDQASLLEATVAIHRRLLPDEESTAEGSGWYHTYVRHTQSPQALRTLLRDYVAEFDELRAPRVSGLGLRWTMGDRSPPKRVVIVHGEGETFEVVAACAARIAGVLVESDIQWSVISSGREADLPSGVSVRFVPEQEAGAGEAGVRVVRCEAVPEDPEEIAEQLFGAQAVQISLLATPRVGWRELEEKPASGDGPDEANDDASRQEAPASAGGSAGKKVARRSRARAAMLIGLGVPLAIGAVVATVRIGMHASARDGASARGDALSVAGAPTATTTEVVRPAPPTEQPTPAQSTERGAPSAVALETETTIVRPMYTGKKRDAEKSVYDIKVPLRLKK